MPNCLCRMTNCRILDILLDQAYEIGLRKVEKQCKHLLFGIRNLVRVSNFGTKPGNKCQDYMEKMNCMGSKPIWKLRYD